MTFAIGWILVSGGLVVGLVAGLLGVGGGVISVPILIAIGYSPIQAVATSALTVLITAISGSWQNLRMGYLDPRRVLSIGLAAIVTAQIGAYLASHAAAYVLLTAFGMLLVAMIPVVEWRRRLMLRETQPDNYLLHPRLARIVTGGGAGLLGGLFGGGGGSILVPLQMLLLNEPIKVAIQTSIGVNIITSVSACFGYAFSGDILLTQGLLLGAGGMLGIQISTRFLPRLPDAIVSLLFRLLLVTLSLYVFWQAWRNYP